MNPGDKAVIAVKAAAAPAAAAMAVLSTREIEAALAWQKRSLDYADAPLAEIVADFNRYNQHRLVIVDPALAKRRFGGTFPAGDYRSLVHVLEETFDVVAERRERETILRLR
jgi:transmembrane sensor